MAKSGNHRSQYQDQVKRHLQHAKEQPVWMQQAVLCLRDWGEDGMSLQHTIAVALQRAYEMGMEGTMPALQTLRIDEEDDEPTRPARVPRTPHPSPVNGHSNGSKRLIRGR